jgi:DNA-binding NtrC family response regulator
MPPHSIRGHNVGASAIILAGLHVDVAAALGAIVKALGYPVLVSNGSVRDLLRVVTVHSPALIIADDVDTIAPCVAGTAAMIPTLVLATDESEPRAVRALRFGAADYFRWPRDTDALLARVAQLVPRADETQDELCRVLVGQSAAMREVRRQVRCASLTDCNVLLVGETGTGKELAAGFVHSLSRRAARPFVSVNCAAIPDTLLESELFGYEKGAFTGANTTFHGKLQQADGGTIFLDEIGDMSLIAQAKVLRAFESKAVYRLGGRTPVSADVRLIAATNADLTAATADHRFRPDLYFRLNVAQIQLPALRERREDIPLLVDHVARECCARYNRHQDVSRDAVKQLASYAWPGNVRELRNVIEATFVNSRARWLSWSDFPSQFRGQMGAPLEKPADNERERLLGALAETHWNKSKAASRLHWSRMTLYRKLAKYRVESR